jgi:uncharacterized membrane protein YhaH (DUF805 family)
MNYYIEVLKKYAVFKGRSRRAEYWYFVLFSSIIGLVLAIISKTTGDTNNTLGGIYSLAVFIPGLAVAIRRLHDVGKSGWMVLIILIPIIGWIWFLILMIRDSDLENNKYGPNPKITPSPTPISQS